MFALEGLHWSYMCWYFNFQMKGSISVQIGCFLSWLECYGWSVGGVFVSIFILFPGCVYISLLQKLSVTGIFTILAEGTCYARGVP
jgi:hypothetical protein